MSRRNRMRKDRILEGLEIGIGQAEARKRLQYELDFAIAKLGLADVANVIVTRHLVDAVVDADSDE